VKKKNIVVIGGGTGLSVLLRGLKTLPVNITAIVTVADDGGSSGRIRKDFDIPPPGDVRNVLAALAEVEPLVEELLQHRFENGNGLSGHSLGNLLLAGMTAITGDFARGISEISKVLNVRGNVLPAANQSVVLHAEMTDGTIVSGESKIPLAKKEIKRVFVTPEEITPLPESIAAIKSADIIVIGPGSLYTSVLPNLLVPQIVNAINEASAKKIYICNVMTQGGETDHYTASDHVQALIEHCGQGIIDYILVNSQQVPCEIKDRYAEEGSQQVTYDRARLEEMNIQIIDDAFIKYDNGYIRHDAMKVSRLLLSLCQKNDSES